MVKWSNKTNKIPVILKCGQFDSSKLNSWKSERTRKAVETFAYGSCSHRISRSPKLPLVFLQLNRNKVHVFYFSNIKKLHLRYWNLLEWLNLVRGFYLYGQEPIARSQQLPHIPFHRPFEFIPNSDSHRNLSDQLQSKARANADLPKHAWKSSKTRLVCRNAVALAYYGSCRFLVMGPCMDKKIHVSCSVLLYSKSIFVSQRVTSGIRNIGI